MTPETCALTQTTTSEDTKRSSQKIQLGIRITKLERKEIKEKRRRKENTTQLKNWFYG
jgi:hypothetical protein